MFFFLADAADNWATIGAALGGAGLSGILLAVINGFWQDRQANRDHDFRKAELIARADINTQAIVEIHDYIEELDEWARQTMVMAESATKATGWPKPPTVPARPVYPTSSQQHNQSHSGDGLPKIGNDTSPH